MFAECGIIGHFGGNKEYCDGQTIKTKNLMKLLESQPDICVRKVDTFYSKQNKMKLLLDTLMCMIRCEYIFLLVSVNGMKVFLPLLYYINKVTRKHIYHYVVGSELLEMVSKNKKIVKYLNAMDANWFEYESGTQFLRGKGVENVITVPNFKVITPVSEAVKYESKDEIYQFCTFSRVMREKGISDAINVISKINRLNNKTVRLDIYGPVDSGYKSEFEALLKLHTDCVTYKGIIESTKSVETLKDYFALLFPTYWAGEGIPGTIIDAFAAGIPVIASDWNANKEIIHHMKQGILYPCVEAETLEEAVIWSLKNIDYMQQMRDESRKEFEKYMSETVLKRILEEFDKNEHRY